MSIEANNTDDFMEEIKGLSDLEFKRWMNRIIKMGEAGYSMKEIEKIYYDIKHKRSESLKI